MGKSVVITGVSSGFGLATASALLERGYRVFGSVRTPADAERVSELLQSPAFTPLLFDVVDQAAIAAAATRVDALVDGDGIGGLINNAGIAPLGPLEHTPVRQLRDVFEVNVFGVMAVTQAFLPLLKRGTGESSAGRIINISSSSGSITFPMLGAYSASKYALESLTDGLRRELRRYGIRVIAIEPGSIRTSIWEKTGGGGNSEGFADTAYGELMAQMPDFFERRLQRSRPIATVTKAITTALESAAPRARYPLDSLWYAGKYLGDGVLDTLIRRQMPRG